MNIFCRNQFIEVGMLRGYKASFKLTGYKIIIISGLADQDHDDLHDDPVDSHNAVTVDL